jgi:flagellar biosynthesis/type III secretory pathway M-ring protein FliF/YscJ
LTKEDIRIIVREEITASEKRAREYIDLKVEALNQRINDVEKNLNDKIDNVNKNFDRVWLLIIALIGLITAAIAIPQLVIAYREKGQKEMQTQIDQLRKELEAMQQWSASRITVYTPVARL